nr:MAG TPA: hypothetical protein [Caudoviricetes sp.]
MILLGLRNFFIVLIVLKYIYTNTKIFTLFHSFSLSFIYFYTLFTHFIGKQRRI